jgi:hypothetical protein
MVDKLTSSVRWKVWFSGIERVAKRFLLVDSIVAILRSSVVDTPCVLHSFIQMDLCPCSFIFTNW